jgi:hypothetical protein
MTICKYCNSEDFKEHGAYPDDKETTFELTCNNCDMDVTEVRCNATNKVLSSVSE